MTKNRSRESKVTLALIACGVVLLTSAIAFIGLFAVGNRPSDYCVDLGFDVYGATGDVSNGTAPTYRYSLVPLGIECAYYVAAGVPRETRFRDLGTVPLYGGLGLTAYGIFRHRREAGLIG
ncbi:hypothetical protein [Marisediminicola sp. LYQ134]|uniref:hypothetical protein n=1 Tax=Marisediminicola sp. LYQ134 TaxID=3391061 RepID=UPI003983C783